MREDGVSLLELLVVVRNLGSQVEACYQTSLNYTSCNTGAKVTADGSVGMPSGTAAGQVNVRSSAVATYTIRAVSKSGSTFDLAKAATAPIPARAAR